MYSERCTENDSNPDSEKIFSAQSDHIHDSHKINRGNHHQKWKVMVIDDDESIHMVSRLVFDGFMFMGQGVEMIYGYSGREARQLITEHPDTAVILLDVVMETDRAGLDVVNYIRHKLNNKYTQIILRTGQAGQLSEVTTARDYEINDYKVKSSLTMENLTTSVITSLRSYREMKNLKNIATVDHSHLKNTIVQNSENRKPFSTRQEILKLINDSTAAMSIKDRQGRYILVNTQFEALLNIQSKALIGKTDHDIFSKTFADKMSQGDNTILDGYDTLNFKEEFIKCGKKVPHMTIKFPLYEKQDMPFSIFSIFTELQPSK